MTKFEGFGPEVRTWFEELRADYSKEYFAAHRPFFEEAIRGQMEALLTALSGKFGGQVRMFRQNRDAVADNRRGSDLVKLVVRAEKAGLGVWGESLATAPRGYPKMS